ncbi:hypothetical protein [Hyphomonas sp.]|uniref:hypothetical protein n=1 Tax=Hyphomonas sp. TaxID=87 RepID=UPI000E039E80|nr:hypothetical protein [Hyphomonas sp.]RCL85577.1 MAG: hypothetical protein DBW63_12095 [Hyphomonas sp.]
MASKDDVEDIVGFYSAKRFGLNLFDVPQVSQPMLILRSLLIPTGPDPKRAEFEEWVKFNQVDIRAHHRKTEYTLIVEGESLDSLPDSAKERIDNSFETLINEFLSSYASEDTDRANYYATLTSALINKVDYFAYRHNANSNYRTLIYGLFILSLAAAGTIGVLISVLSSLLESP